MSFNITDKIALISGGASGIGLSYAKELLRNGLKGVTLADINDKFGEKALEDIQQEFGANRAIYVKTDVTSKESYEEAFEETVKHYKNLDILINNAGLLNDNIWEKQVAVNVNGTINGMLLGLETYIPKYKSSPEGVIVNISSIVGVNASAVFPVYSATKHAIIGLSKAFGDKLHYDRTKVKVLALCPGITETTLITGLSNHTLAPPYQALFDVALPCITMQKPKNVAAAMVHIIKHAETGTVWVAEFDKTPYEFTMPRRESFAPK